MCGQKSENNITFKSHIVIGPDRMWLHLNQFDDLGQTLVDFYPHKKNPQIVTVASLSLNDVLG